MQAAMQATDNSSLVDNYDDNYDTSILVTANFVITMNITTANKLPTSCEHESAATALQCRLQVCT